MAERRMFAKTIVLSDAFLDMPMTARCLYFTLSMLADDDGFINSTKGIIRQCGASDDDLRILLAKRFVISFDSGVIVIKHWRINNYLRNDRHHETQYKAELGQLDIKDNGSYTEKTSDVGIPSIGIPRLGKVSEGKESIGKDIDMCTSEEDAHSPHPSKKFQKPTLDEVKDYIREMNYKVNAEKWYSYYEANGWKVGRNPMKNWKCALKYWNTNEGAFRDPRGRDRSFDSTDGKECLFL